MDVVYRPDEIVVPEPTPRNFQANQSPRASLLGLATSCPAGTGLVLFFSFSHKGRAVSNFFRTLLPPPRQLVQKLFVVPAAVLGITC